MSELVREGESAALERCATRKSNDGSAGCPFDAPVLRNVAVDDRHTKSLGQSARIYRRLAGESMASEELASEDVNGMFGADAGHRRSASSKQIGLSEMEHDA